ncbi:MAG: DUF5690 family protein [Aureliella sp.]
MVWLKHRNAALVLSACAAFSTYFCMYAFRKPFSAGTFEDQELWGFGLKSLLVTSQLLGYVLSKFIGIKVISEMPSKYRAISILGLIGFAELALVGFATLPTPAKVVCLFLNGLPLGMVFGLVLGYLEGRKNTEALAAVLCASFIMSSGVVKSIGRTLIENYGVSDFAMPMIVGGLFTIPLLISVWLLQYTPPPDEQDRELRSERTEMNGKQRWTFFRAYWPGLTLLLLIYVVLTTVRTLRDDFSVELWSEFNEGGQPEVYAISETSVAVVVTLISGLMIWIRGNLQAIQLCLATMAAAFALTIFAAFAQPRGIVSPMTFMILCGIGLYIPYVAFHTTIFERLIALSRRVGNLGFLMYLADAIGYLGYSAALLLAPALTESGQVLPAFRDILVLCSIGASVMIVFLVFYFQATFAGQQVVTSQVKEADHPMLPGESGQAS